MALPVENRFTIFEALVATTITTGIWFIFKYYYDRRRVFKMGSKLPGPKPWPMIGNAWHFLGSKVDIITKLKKYEGYEKLFAVWLGHELNVFVTSPDFAEMYCQSTNLLKRSEKLKFLDIASAKGLLLANGAEWKKARKLVESALPYSVLKNAIPLFQMQAEIMTERLQGEVGKPCFTVLHYAQECTFDIINEITVGFEQRAQKSELPALKDVDLIADLSRRKLYNALHQWDFLYKFFPEGKQFYSVVHELIAFLNDMIIDKRKKYEKEATKGRSEENLQMSKRKFFLQALFDDETLSLTDIRHHIVSMILAGYETTSSAISCALIMLALHPDVQEKAFQEISTVVDGDFDEEKLRKLEYLEMVIKETLRLFPTVPLSYRKATGDVQIGEYLIPAGAEVSINIYQLHRNPEQYDDPHKFNPDHFLPENAAKRHPYAYLPFLSGMRKCAGTKLAMIVLKITVAKLLLSYKFECDYRTIDDVKFRGDITLDLNDRGRVRILKRGQKSHS